MTLKLVIVDDEPLARLRLRSLLAEDAQPRVEVVGEAGDAQALFDLLRTQACDAVLLDVHLPGLDGLELAARLERLSVPPAVVFVTAHDQHALRAFELGAVDYLTKPVRRARLTEALRRVALRHGAPEAGSLAPEEPTVLLVRERQRVLRIPLDEIIWARAAHKLVTLHTPTRSHVLDESLADLEGRLGPGFVRVHRNALVAQRAMRELQHRSGGADDEDAWAVRLAPGDEWVAVSRRQLAAVRAAIGHGGGFGVGIGAAAPGVAGAAGANSAVHETACPEARIAEAHGPGSTAGRG